MTGLTHSILLKNSFESESRYNVLDLSTYTRPGYDVYKVDVNVTNNQIVAQDDWVHVLKTQTTNDYRIDNATLRNHNEMLGQQITGTMRYQVKNISLYLLITTADGQSTSNPRLQLWNNKSAGGDVPGTSKWSADLPKTTGGNRIWVHTGCNYIINASAPSNRSWYVVINGTDWANGLPGDDYIRWSYAPNALAGGRYMPWDIYSPHTWYPTPSSRRFTMAYQRLLVNDNNNQNRTMTPATAGLAINGTLFDSSGRASISGTDIKALNFTSSVTSLATSVSVKAYYRATLACDRRFFSDGSANVRWNITSPSLVTFPTSTDNRGFKITIPTGWTVTGVYNASSIGGLASAPNYTTYSIAMNVLSVTGIKSDSYWQVRCTSTNQITGMTFLVSGVPVTSANKSNTLQFRVSLSSPQSSGNMTLGVYDPAYIGSSRTFSTFNSSFGGSVTSVRFPADWAIGPNVVGYYRVQARWNITDAVGFVSTTFLVLGRMNIGLSSVVQYGSPLAQLGGRYQGQYGDNIVMTHTMADLTNGSSIPNLAYTYTTNGTPDASGTTSQPSISPTLPFMTRAVNNYSVVVTFRRTYYHNYTATVNIEIAPCPTTISNFAIRRGGIPLYQNGSGIYFTNSSDFIVSYEYRNSRTNALITTASSADVYEGSNHFTSSSSTGSFAVTVTPNILAAGVVFNFQATASNPNYVTGQYPFLLVRDSSTPITNIVYTPAFSPNFVNTTTMFTLTASDPGIRASGVNKTYYRIGTSGAFTQYTGPFNLLGYSNGTITIEYYSIDNATNVQAFNSTTVRLDTIAPNTTISVLTYGTNFVNGTRVFTLTGTDNAGGSGILRTEYRIDGGAWTVGTT
ncbi:MAG: hypothetical protein Q6370_000550, partial [Candidatus Sigynarchaeota archaeon]